MPQTISGWLRCQLPYREKLWSHLKSYFSDMDRRIISAIGVEDSPIAKRGWAPRSITPTLKPLWCNARAVSVPLNPDPAMSISKCVLCLSILMFTITRNRRFDRLIQIDRFQPLFSLFKTIRAVRKKPDIPGIHHHLSPMKSERPLKNFF